MGIDLGNQIDPTVINIMRKGQRRTVGHERLVNEDWNVQVDTIETKAKFWNNATAYIDETGLGAPVCAELKKRGVHVKAINLTKEKSVLIDELVAAIEQEKVKFPNIPVLIKELKAMRRYTQDRNGRDLKYHKLCAPVGQHDDCVIALALAYHGCKSGETMPGIKPRYLGSRR